MATIIRVNIANGYRPQVDAYVEAHPGGTLAEAVQRWVDQRYGDWIARNITEDYGFERVSPAQFDVRFEQRDHAEVFQAAIGGQEVADGA